ncbi:MAG: NADH dehydrogenase, partial [uncultured Corynebacteriales bacterium]
AGQATHPHRRRGLRRDVHRPAAAAEAAAQCADHRCRPAELHDLPAVPPGDGGRVPGAAARGGSPAQGAQALPGGDRDGHLHRPRPPHGHGAAGRGPRGAPDVRPDRRRPRLRRPHPADPRPGRVRHRLQDRRRGHLPAQPRAVPAGLRGLGDRRGAPPPGADLRLHRRRLRRHRGVRRAGGHGAVRDPLLRLHHPGRHALGADRGDRAGAARGQRAAVRVHGAAAARAQDGRPAQHPGRVADRRARAAVRRRGVRRRHHRVDGRGQGQPDARPHRPAAGRQGPADLQGHPAGGRGRGRLVGRRLRRRARPDPAGPDHRPVGPARGPPDQDAGRQHRRHRAPRHAVGVPAQVRRLRGQPRPLPRRRRDLRRQAARAAGLVHAPDVPPLPGAHAQPQGPGARRLDAGDLLPARGGLPGPAAAAAPGVRAGRAAEPGPGPAARRRPGDRL